MARIVHTENGVSREYTLGEVPVTVGRAARHTIPTMDSRASRDHIKIEPGGGGYVAQDLGSRNGTLLNGKPLEKPSPLRPGDRLMIGAAVFQFLEGTITTPAPERSEVPLAPPSHSTRDVSAPEANSVQHSAAAPQPPAAPAPAPEARRSPANLSLLSPDGTSAIHPLASAPTVIGRGKDCTISVEDEKLSSRHVEVSETDQGILVKDLKSTNGTKFGGTPFESRLFRDGEVFTAGSIQFRVIAPSFPAAAKAAGGFRRPGPLALAGIAALVIISAAAVVAPWIVSKFVTVAPPVALDTENLLGAAGSLERGPEGWQIGADANYQVAPDPDHRKDGGASLRVNGVDTRDHSLFTASSSTVAASGPLRLEGWVRANQLDGRAGFRIEWLRAGEPCGETPTDLLEGTFDWKKLSVVAAPPPGADGARAACVIRGLTTVVWFDALKLTAAKESPGGAGWNTPWGRVTIDDAAAIRLDAAGGPLLWNGTFKFEEKGLPQSPTPLWAGARDGEAQSTGTGYRVARKIARLGSVTLFGLHSDEEESLAWQVDIAKEGTVIFASEVEPGAAARITTRSGETTDPRDGDFDGPQVSEMVFGDGPSFVFDSPADVKLVGTRLALRWPRTSEKVTVHIRCAASWVEREVKAILADANAAAKASRLGKALSLFEDLSKRYPSRDEGRAAAGRASDLRKQGDEAEKKARFEVGNAKKFGGDANKKLALDLVDVLERQWEGSGYAAAGAQLRRELVPEAEKPPDPPPDNTKPPVDREPIESARKLLEWAEESLKKEEWLKAEIYSRNVMDRWPGTPEETKASELLGRATSGAKAARERDTWITETLLRARNLVKNHQPDKAIPLFEEVLEKYPDSVLAQGVRDELDKLKR